MLRMLSKRRSAWLKNPGQGADANLRESFDILRKKWGQVPGGEATRVMSADMLQLSDQELLKKSASEVYLEVRVSNTGAVELYQKLGYKVTGRLEAYYKDGEPALLMASSLGQ
jgi:RimJ/RimL family protein N-acetyltransferase